MRFRLPFLSQPCLPTSTGFSPTSPVSRSTSCQSTIAPQIPFSFLVQALIFFGLVGMSFSRTSEKVCGPTWRGLVLFLIFRSSPAATVSG